MSTYLITGGTRGIGRAVVDELAANDLIVAARDDEALNTLCKSLRSAQPMPVDLAQPGAIADAVSQARLPDRLDGIVHSAGVNPLGRIAEIEPARWADGFAVNVTAAAELTRLFLPALRQARGTVVFVNSLSGRQVGGPGSGAYAATKHALVALAEALRLEEPAVRVTTVFPGRVATDMQRQLRAYEGEEYRAEDFLQPATVARIVGDALRLPDDGTVADVTVVPHR